MTAPPVDPDAGDLDIRTVPGSDGCTVVVSGEVDTRSAPVLGDRLRELLQDPAATTVELDLRQVTFLDSAGLTALVGVHRAAEAAGRVLRMRCGTTRAVLRPLQITGLTTVFTLVDPPGG
ncbi:STAS domain-containing protein [Modestobacter versicolor]|uniref:Anti-sigma factor antagonist n=1 Tax=Modestobacter versicolor TaxID=429133 RepID=A0A323VRW2_9ACTN|nr:STAS domain-containing protein [Modestobacter versicolor]MBB3677517.1 anti-sigma B factor antagonist [Modestobacter versicolor]PZA21848.1 anti-sigma factor antagonist [Modestobacter versicolor]